MFVTTLLFKLPYLHINPHPNFAATLNYSANHKTSLKTVFFSELLQSCKLKTFLLGILILLQKVVFGESENLTPTPIKYYLFYRSELKEHSSFSVLLGSLYINHQPCPNVNQLLNFDSLPFFFYLVNLAYFYFKDKISLYSYKCPLCNL